MSDTLLHSTSFASLPNWSVQYLLQNTFSYNDKYDLVRIGDFLTRNKTVIAVRDDQTYKRVTIKINNGGVYLRDTEKGVNIGTKNQFLAKTGQFIFSKIDARNGAFGIIPDDLDAAIVTNDFPIFDIDPKRVNAQFLVLIATTPQFIRFAQSCSSGTTNRQRIDIDLFLEQKIPLPTLDEQNRLIDNYNQKIAQAKRKEKEVVDLEHSIEKYWLDKLGIKEFKTKVSNKGLQTIHFKNLDRWDVLSTDLRILQGLKNSKYPLKKIGEIYTFPSKTWDKRKHEGDWFNYIELGAIDPVKGVKETKKVALLKAPSRATQKVTSGELIIGTTRPYLKRFAIVENRNNNDICSSGFSIVSPSNEYDLTYLIEFLFSYYGTEQLKNRMTGTTYPAITNAELKEILIPFPEDIKVQQEIADHISGLKQQMKHLKDQAQQNRKDAIIDFEKEIFTV